MIDVGRNELPVIGGEQPRVARVEGFPDMEGRHHGLVQALEAYPRHHPLHSQETRSHDGQASVGQLAHIFRLGKDCSHGDGVAGGEFGSCVNQAALFIFGFACIGFKEAIVKQDG